jgi:hypothetical protein
LYNTIISDYDLNQVTLPTRGPSRQARIILNNNNRATNRYHFD